MGNMLILYFKRLVIQWISFIESSSIYFCKNIRIYSMRTLLIKTNKNDELIKSGIVVQLFVSLVKLSEKGNVL